MSNAFALLNTRSIFYKGYLPQEREGNNSGPTTRSYGTDLPNASPASLIFNGVIVAPSQTYAFIENLGAGKVATVSVGDAIAGGKVDEISFNQLIFESQGRKIKIEIGHNFNGEVMAAATSTPTTQGSGESSGTASAAGSSTAPADSGGNDILERMRKRRLQEMGGGK
jgi:hypothetical protein